MLYSFHTGHVWQQVEATTERHNVARPLAMAMDRLNGMVLKVDGINTVAEVHRVARR